MNSDVRILIIGCKGLLAGAVDSRLRATGLSSITGVDADTCDITDQQSVNASFARVKPELVINCAAFTNVDGAEKNPALANAVNGTGVGYIAQACRRHCAKMVHFSTDYVFDGMQRRPIQVNDVTGPISAYGKSKLLGEELLREHAPENWLLIRTAWLYGPNGPNFVNTIVNAARAGKPLKVVNDQFGCPTFTLDLTEATLQLLEKKADGIWHVSNTGETNWFEYAKVILQEYGIDHPVEPITSADWKMIKPDSATRPLYSVFDVTPYAKLTGKPLPDWRDALLRFRVMHA